jgi:hypothetical protein
MTEQRKLAFAVRTHTLFVIAMCAAASLILVIVAIFGAA